MQLLGPGETLTLNPPPRMKASFFSLVSVLVLLLVANGSCKKADDYMADAVIVGYDPRMCACCGGLMISFKGPTTVFDADDKTINNAPDLGLSPNEAFPLYVQVNYTEVTGGCHGAVLITKLKRK